MRARFSTVLSFYRSIFRERMEITFFSFLTLFSFSIDTPTKRAAPTNEHLRENSTKRRQCRERAIEKKEKLFDSLPLSRCSASISCLPCLHPVGHRAPHSFVPLIAHLPCSLFSGFILCVRTEKTLFFLFFFGSFYVQITARHMGK